MPFFVHATADLERDWAALPAGDPLRARLAEPVAMLRDWDKKWSTQSEATTVACFWADELWTLAGRRRPPHGNMWEAMRGLAATDRLAALGRAIDRLEHDWGRWRIAWGEVNRFQRR
jgi:acyl-homoserine-lactone acylase